MAKLTNAGAVLLAVVLLVLGPGTGATPAARAATRPSPGAKRPEVKVKWEYKVVTAAALEKLARKGSRDRLTDGLNKLGEQGWELVAVVPGGPAFGGGALRMAPPGGPGMPPALPKIKPPTYLFKRPR